MGGFYSHYNIMIITISVHKLHNFYNYFSITGSFNNRIKENDTIIFMGTFSSKGKLNINEKAHYSSIKWILYVFFPARFASYKTLSAAS